MNPVVVTELVEFARWAIDALRAYNAGEKSETQIMSEFEAMQRNVAAASQRWRDSTAPE